MKGRFDYVWPFVGLAAVVLSIYLLSREFTNPNHPISVYGIWLAIIDRGPHAFALCVASTLVAYAALAAYDRVALAHVGRHVSWVIVSIVSFTAYALAHNIGASVFSQGVVRYRAYQRFGLSVAQVAVISAFCAFTFAYGAMFLAGLVLLFEPSIVQRLFDVPSGIALALGVALLAAVALYQVGALMHFKSLVIRGFHIEYPRPTIAATQLVLAPLEIIGAAGIIYFALPELGNPGFPVVLGVFLASFCAGLISSAPGGIGVFEFVFLKAMPEIPSEKVLAALIVFRVLYLLIPLLLGCVVVLFSERQGFVDAFRVFLSRRGMRPRTRKPQSRLPR